MRAWLTGDLARVAGLEADDVSAMLDAQSAQTSLKGVSAAAAMMLHADAAPEREVLDFLMHYSSGAQARKSLEFITQPTLRAYIFTYPVGGELVANVLKLQGREGFARLLSEPVTPGELREVTQG